MTSVPCKPRRLIEFRNLIISFHQTFHNRDSSRLGVDGLLRIELNISEKLILGNLLQLIAGQAFLHRLHVDVIVERGSRKQFPSHSVVLKRFQLARSLESQVVFGITGRFVIHINVRATLFEHLGTLKNRLKRLSTQFQGKCTKLYAQLLLALGANLERRARNLSVHRLNRSALLRCGKTRKPLKLNITCNDNTIDHRKCRSFSHLLSSQLSLFDFGKVLLKQVKSDIHHMVQPGLTRTRLLAVNSIHSVFQKHHSFVKVTNLQKSFQFHGIRLHLIHRLEVTFAQQKLLQCMLCSFLVRLVFHTRKPLSKNCSIHYYVNIFWQLFQYFYSDISYCIFFPIVSR